MKNVRFSIWYLPAALLVLLLVQSLFVAPRPVPVSYSQLQTLTDENAIERALITSEEVRFDRLARTLESGETLEGDALLQALDDAKLRDVERRPDPKRTMVA